MKALVPFLASVALLSSIGCIGAFNLTPGAVHCGTHPKTQMDVWVDGVGIDPAVEHSANLPDGGQRITYTAVPYMTCDQAMATIDQAVLIGNTNGFWIGADEKDYGFLNGIRIEFVDANNLKAIGEQRSSGYTVDYLGVHESAVAYEADQNAGVDYTKNGADSFVTQNTWPSAVVLVHEMTHMLEASGFMDLGNLKGNETSSGGHCNWSKSYAPKYANLGWAQYASYFQDSCQHKQCSGSVCTPENN